MSASRCPALRCQRQDQPLRAGTVHAIFISGGRGVERTPQEQRHRLRGQHGAVKGQEGSKDNGTLESEMLKFSPASADPQVSHQPEIIRIVIVMSVLPGQWKWSAR